MCLHSGYTRKRAGIGPGPKDRFTKGLDCPPELRPAECGQDALLAPIHDWKAGPPILNTAVDSPLRV